MTVMFGTFLLLIIAIAILPIRLSSENMTAGWWRYIFPFSGHILWYLLAALDFGSTPSLLNFIIEISRITVVSLITAWLYLGTSYFRKKYIPALLKVITIIPMIFALVVRFSMHTILE